MVMAVTSFGRNGVYDWLMQRLSAVVLLAYGIFIIAYLLLNPELTYGQWRGLFDQTWMRIFTLLSLLSLCAHAWIGMWSVVTDYIKAVGPRLLVQTLSGLLVFSILIWGIQTLWGL